MARALARRSAALCAAASFSLILSMYYFARRSISFSSLYFLYEDGGSREEPPCEGRFSLDASRAEARRRSPPEVPWRVTFDLRRVSCAPGSPG